MGPDLLPVLLTYARDGSMPPKSRGLVFYGLAKTVEGLPELRRQVIAGLAGVLDSPGRSSQEVTAYAAFALMEMAAREAWPAVFAAHRNGAAFFHRKRPPPGALTRVDPSLLITTDPPMTC